MATRFVDPAGSTPPGYDSYYTTLALANIAASDGDEIVLANAVHIITGYLSVESLTWRNVDDDEDYSKAIVTYDPGSPSARPVVQNGKSATFKGITFMGQVHDNPMIQIVINSSGFSETQTFIGCKFDDNGTAYTGFSAGGIGLGENNLDAVSLIVNRCVFSNLSSLKKASAIGVFKLISATIMDCSFFNCHSTSGTSERGSAIWLEGCEESTISGCVFSECNSGADGAAEPI